MAKGTRWGQLRHGNMEKIMQDPRSSGKGLSDVQTKEDRLPWAPVAAQPETKLFGRCGSREIGVGITMSVARMVPGNEVKTVEWCEQVKAVCETRFAKRATSSCHWL